MNFWQFLDRNGVGVFLFAVILVITIGHVLTSLASHCP
jgi:hypothetical protein